MRSLELLEAVRPHAERTYVCVNCTYEPNKDLGKYHAIMKNGKMKILLEQAALTVYVCPKCKGGHYTKDFVTEERSARFHKRKREKERIRRVESLKRVFTQPLGEKATLSSSCVHILAHTSKFGIEQ